MATTITVPAWIIVVLLLADVGVLATWYHRSRSWTALALLLPMIYMAVVYTIIDSMEVTAIQLYGRLGFAVLLICQGIVFAQLAGILPGGKRHGS